MKSAWLAHFKKLMIVLIALPLVTCGGKKSRSDAASDFSIVPDEPIVILGDTKDDILRNVSGPWFFFRLKMTNADSTDSITIIAFEMEISGTDETGYPFKRLVSFSASDFNHSLTDAVGNEVQCSYSTFGTFPAGSGEMDVGVGGTGPCEIPTTRFFIGSLPKKTQGQAYRFTVKVRPLGWFGTYDAPSDRFDTSVRFSTR